jgi:hypothetical protein
MVSDYAIEYFRNAIYEVKFPSFDVWFSCGATSFNVYGNGMHNVQFGINTPVKPYYNTLVLVITPDSNEFEILFNNIQGLYLKKGEKLNYSDLVIKKKDQYLKFL